MNLITAITAGITDFPKDGQTAQEARDDAVVRGVLPIEQSPHLKETSAEPASPDEPSPV